MCGIVCAFDLKVQAEELRPQILKMAKRVRHRGPDWSGIYANDNALLAHERLAIVDPTSGIWFSPLMVKSTITLP